MVKKDLLKPYTEPELSGSVEELDGSGIMELERRYDYLPYSKFRIERIFKLCYRWKLETIWQGYKANRNPYYHEIYRVVEIETGKIVVERVSLDSIRKVLARNGFALYDEKSTGKRIHLDNEVIYLNRRNPDAEKFMELVNSIRNMEETDNA